MILFPTIRNKKNDTTDNTNNTTTMITKSTPLNHREHNEDVSDDTTVLLSCGSDDTDSSSSSDQSDDHDATTRRNALNIQNQSIVANDTASNKKKSVSFHVTTKDCNSSHDGSKEKTSSKRELISFDEDKKKSNKTWYSVKEIKAFKKYQKTYAKYLQTIDPNDIDKLLNAFDEVFTDNHKIICLRGMEKFLQQRPTDNNSNNDNTIMSISSSERRKALCETVLSMQLQKQKQQQRKKQNNNTNNNDENTRICCNNDDMLMNYYNEIIRIACLSISLPSVQHAYDIAQKDSYIAINHNQVV